MIASYIIAFLIFSILLSCITLIFIKWSNIEAVKIINRIKYQEKLIFDELEKDE